MTREEKEQLIIQTILRYELYKAGKEGKEELQLPLEEMEEAITFLMRMILDGEMEFDGVVYKRGDKNEENI